MEIQNEICCTFIYLDACNLMLLKNPKIVLEILKYSTDNFTKLVIGSTETVSEIALANWKVLANSI